MGFDKRTREQLRSYAEYQIPLTLKDCLIQKNKFKDFLEVVIKSHTKIEASKVKFEISDIKTVGSTVIKLNQIDEYSTDERVTVRVTVLKVNDPQSVGGGKMKQDVVIADDTAKTIMTLWETNIDLLKPLKSYQLNRLIVKAYQGKNQLSFPSVSSIDEIEDIEDVIEQFTSSEDEGDECLEAITVSGIRELETVYICINCIKNITPVVDQEITECDFCRTSQRIGIPKQSAKLIFETNRRKLTLKANNDILQQITGSQTTTAKDLLYAPQFDCYFNRFNVITNISRK